MANSKEIVYLRGNGYWMKVLGEPVDNYDKSGKEWVFDLALDKDGLNQIKNVKVQGKSAFNVKDKDDERGKFISFRQRELKRNGEKNKPIRVIDAAGNPWPQDVKLGNGTVVDVKAEVIDFGKGMFPGIYPRAIRILEHVPYAASEFAPLSEDDKYFKQAQEAEKNIQRDDMDEFRKDFGLGHTATDEDELDDDVPM